MNEETLGKFQGKYYERDCGYTSLCWQWTGAISVYGYGIFQVGKKTCRAHKVSYEHYHGLVPEGLQIDHLCQHRSCVNPKHLEAVTSRVNTLRSNAPSALNAQKTHCKRGHEFTPENTYAWRGKRICRACRDNAYRSDPQKFIDRARVRYYQDPQKVIQRTKEWRQRRKGQANNV